MHKRTVGIILASTLAVGGGAVALTPASATDSDNPVKSRLGGIKSALSGLVKDGTLTQEQADKVAKTLDEELPKRGPGHRGPGRWRGVNLTVAAKALGLSQPELRSKLNDGMSLAAIAKDEGIKTEVLVKALVAEAEARLDAAVKDGKLTKAQADKRKAKLTERISDRINKVRPQRPKGDAGRPFDGPDDDPEPPASPS